MEKVKNNNVKQKNNKKRKKNITKIIIIILVLIIIILVILSRFIKVKNITIIGNYKVSNDEIIKKSGLNINSRLFSRFNMKIKKDIKTIGYIENVNVTKKINGEVIIEVEERVETYMIYIEGKYAYINNQGYILNITETPINLPVIKGYSSANVQAGNRLETKELKKLDEINQIMEAANSKGLKEKITAIDISNKLNYILELEEEKKTIEFGDSSNINVKILWITEILERTKNEEGVIVVSGSDISKAYFREKV